MVFEPSSILTQRVCKDISYFFLFYHFVSVAKKIWSKTILQNRMKRKINSPIPLATSVMTYKPFEFIDSAAARNMLWFLKVRDPWWVVAGAGAVVVANLPYCSFEQ